MTNAQRVACIAQWFVDDNGTSMAIGDEVTLLLVDATDKDRAWYGAVLGAEVAGRITGIVDPGPSVDADGNEVELREESGLVVSIQRFRYELDAAYMEASEVDLDLLPSPMPGSVVVAEVQSIEAWADASGYLVVFETDGSNREP